MAPFSVIVFDVVWTIAVSGAKQLRFRLKTDYCGRGLILENLNNPECKILERLVPFEAYRCLRSEFNFYDFHCRLDGPRSFLSFRLDKVIWLAAVLHQVTMSKVIDNLEAHRQERNEEMELLPGQVNEIDELRRNNDLLETHCKSLNYQLELEKNEARERYIDPSAGTNFRYIVKPALREVHSKSKPTPVSPKHLFLIFW